MVCVLNIGRPRVMLLKVYFELLGTRRYFNRDVECIRTFFRRRFRYESVLYPRFRTVLKESEGSGGAFRLDVVASASGFGKKEMKSLEEVSFG